MSDKCCEHVHGTGPVQTLDEMDWERGLWGTSHSGDLIKVTCLLNKGRYVDERDHSGYTALHYAARNGHVEICSLLLTHGANVDAVTKEGRATPLHRAASMGKADVIELLLAHQADCLIQDADGKTALHRAAEGQHSSICEMLLKRNSELRSVIDNKGHLPLHYALSQSLIAILKDHQS